MIHYVHQLAANCACVLFGAGQVACSGFISAFIAKNRRLLWLGSSLMKALRAPPKQHKFQVATPQSGRDATMLPCYHAPKRSRTLQKWRCNYPRLHRCQHTSSLFQSIVNVKHFISFRAHDRVCAADEICCSESMKGFRECRRSPWQNVKKYTADFRERDKNKFRQTSKQTWVKT